MDTSEAIEECERWLESLRIQRERAKKLAEYASLARDGKLEEAMRMKAESWVHAPKVYDGSKLEEAVKELIFVLHEQAYENCIN